MQNTLLVNELVNETHSWIDKVEKEEKLIRKNEIDSSVFGEKMGLMAKLFGCWHRNISRPFVQGKTAYRCCLQCGARKQFNPETLQTHGAFYFPPAVAATMNAQQV